LSPVALGGVGGHLRPLGGDDTGVELFCRQVHHRARQEVLAGHLHAGRGGSLFFRRESRRRGAGRALRSSKAERVRGEWGGPVSAEILPLGAQRGTGTHQRMGRERETLEGTENPGTRRRPSVYE
jgi:hypothetical protein